jgi:hypothetical protein
MLSIGPVEDVYILPNNFDICRYTPTFHPSFTIFHIPRSRKRHTMQVQVQHPNLSSLRILPLMNHIPQVSLAKCLKLGS